MAFSFGNSGPSAFGSSIGGSSAFGSNAGGSTNGQTKTGPDLEEILTEVSIFQSFKGGFADIVKGIGISDARGRVEGQIITSTLAH